MDSFRSQNGMNDGENRMKFIASKVQPHSVTDENTLLLKRMKIYNAKMSD